MRLQHWVDNKLLRTYTTNSDELSGEATRQHEEGRRGGSPYGARKVADLSIPATSLHPVIPAKPVLTKVGSGEPESPDKRCLAC